MDEVVAQRRRFGLYKIFFYVEAFVHESIIPLKVFCAPKRNDFEFPIIKTTKLLVETRSGT